MFSILLKVGLILVVLLLLAACSAPYLLDSFGGRARGERLLAMQESPNFNSGTFRNRTLIPSFSFSDIGRMLRKTLWDRPEQRTPDRPLPVVSPDLRSFGDNSNEDVEVVWLGHSTALIQIDGYRVLTDPVFSQRSSPFSFFGPKRFSAPPLGLDDLPPLDAALISHDHYDHLDRDSIRGLIGKTERFYVPLGVGAHLERWGVPAEQVVELDWWGESRIGEGLRLVATPARHFSGRGLADRDKTLWASWALIGPRHRVFFGGDSGLHDGFEEIGRKLGPFDMTLLENGAYDRAWPDLHMTPEQTVQAHNMLKGKILLPIHWATFNLAYHSWDEPDERIREEAWNTNTSIVMPRLGETVRLSRPSSSGDWWSGLAAEGARGLTAAEGT